MSTALLKFIKSVCVQTAVYWSSPIPDGFGGATFAEPKEIKVRWDEEINLLRDDTGKEIISKARILTTDNLEEKGYIALMSLEELGEKYSDKYNPKKIPEAREIRRSTKSPFFRSTDKFVQEVYL